MAKYLKTTAIAVALACSAVAQAGDLTVISFGGANKDEQQKAYYQPFEKATGIHVVPGE